jgi:hypothetical protein
MKFYLTKIINLVKFGFIAEDHISLV